MAQCVILKLDDVSKQFNGFTALSNVSFELEKGRVLAVLGPSGSGKTTLLRCIAGFEQLKTGNIDYTFGHDTIRVDPSTNSPLNFLAGRIGFVFQDLQLWPHMTVIKNVIEAPIRAGKLSKKKAIRKAFEICERLDIKEQIKKFPSELSIGQQQRVAIARTLATEPALILMDEITSALDPEVVLEIASIIKDLSASGITCIVVSHQMAFARKIAERMVFLNDGRLIYHGDMPDLLSLSSLPSPLQRFIVADEISRRDNHV